MARFAPAAVLLAVLIAFGCVVSHKAQAQDFPYMVPAAPEFDDRGNPLQAHDADTPSPMQGNKRNQPQAAVDRSAADNPVDYRTVRPYAPRTTGPRAAAVAPSDQPLQFSSPPQAPFAGPETNVPEPPKHRSRRSARHQPVPEQPVQQPPEQAQAMQPGQLDCSRFPQLIAQAPNQAEMQLVAREYLTCLLKTGWNMDMARNQVINTIQTAYKLTR